MVIVISRGCAPAFQNPAGLPDLARRPGTPQERLRPTCSYSRASLGGAGFSETRGDAQPAWSTDPPLPWHPRCPLRSRSLPKGQTKGDLKERVPQTESSSGTHLGGDHRRNGARSGTRARPSLTALARSQVTPLSHRADPSTHRVDASTHRQRDARRVRWHLGRFVSDALLGSLVHSKSEPSRIIFPREGWTGISASFQPGAASAPFSRDPDRLRIPGRTFSAKRASSREPICVWRVNQNKPHRTS